jgi:hypothetical protein
MKKLIAGFMTALMALLPLVSAAQLGNYPAFLEDADGTLDALVVIGSAANVADVVGAVDLAVRLAEVGSASVSQACSGASAAVTGTRKDSVPLSGDLSAIFPASGVLQAAHYSGFADAQFSWRGTDYDYREQVTIANVGMSHDLATSNVNGTEKMLVESGDIKYQYVFEKALTGTGSVSDPNYTYPVNIMMLGQEFAIVGTASNQIKMLHGSIGTATATTPVVYGDYSIYSDLGSTSGTSWARVMIKDADGNTVDTFTVNSGDSKQSTATGLTVQITAVRALMDGTVVGTDLVVGPTTEGVTKTYDTTADVTSTGTASDRFPGETDWGIQVASGDFATAGAIAATDMIEVVYKPSSTQYLVAGEKVSLPNSYGDLEFEGWNTDKFAAITVEPIGGTISAYNSSAETQAFGNLNGIKISTDVPGSIVSTSNNGYDAAYVLFNYSRNALDHVPVFIGFYDSSKQKVLVNGSIAGQATGVPSGEMRSKVIDFGNATTTAAFNILSYPFKLKYSNAGDAEFYLNVTVTSTAYSGRVIHTLAAGPSAASGFVIKTGYQNKTSAGTSQAFEFKLGGTAASAQAYEVNATTHSTERDAGKKSQEIVTDRGLLLQDTNAYGASDKVVFKIPFKTLNASVYFGKKGEGVSGDTVTYTNYPSVPITSAIAKLDSELTTANKAKNLISVGGSCVNSVTADALELEYPTCGAASTIPEDKGLIKVVDSPYTDGKVVVVIAGWEKDNTRAACSAAQQYDTKLTGVTAEAVEVTGTIGAPTVTEVA